MANDDRTELARLLGILARYPSPETQSVEDLRRGIDRFGDDFAIEPGLQVRSVELGGVPAEYIDSGNAGPVLLYLHGGGFSIGSIKSHRHLVARLTAASSGRSYSLDYRRAPEAPFPAALDDAVSAYRSLIARYDAKSVVIVGDSAGGGLAFSCAIEAAAAALPAPSAIVAFSPWVTLSLESTAYERLAGADPVLSPASVDYFARNYVGQADRSNPRFSPLLANLKGLPPTLIQVGEQESFIDDCASMHAALQQQGVMSEIQIWPRMFHVWQLYYPMLAEGREAIERAAAFIREHVNGR